jgi:TonB family protein
MKLMSLLVFFALAGFSQVIVEGIDASTAITYHAGTGVGAPILIERIPPAYSEEAYKARYQALVSLSLVVGVDGKPEDLKVVESAGLGLDETDVDAVKKWRFVPATQDGHPVRVSAEVKASFRLRYWRTTRLDFIAPPYARDPVSLGFFGMTGESCGPTSVVFSIGADAVVSDVRVISISNESIRRQLVKEITFWRFNPARQNDTFKPVNAEAKVTLDCGAWPVRTLTGWYWP